LRVPFVLHPLSLRTFGPSSETPTHVSALLTAGATGEHPLFSPDGDLTSCYGLFGLSRGEKSGNDPDQTEVAII